MPWGRPPLPFFLRKTSSAKYQTFFESQRSPSNSPKGIDETNSLSCCAAPGFAFSLCVSFSVPAKSSRAKGPGFSTHQSHTARHLASCSALRNRSIRTAPCSANAFRLEGPLSGPPVRDEDQLARLAKLTQHLLCKIGDERETRLAAGSRPHLKSAPVLQAKPRERAKRGRPIGDREAKSGE